MSRRHTCNIFKLLTFLLYGKCSQTNEGPKNNFARPKVSKKQGVSKGKHWEAISVLMYLSVIDKPVIDAGSSD